DDRDGFASAGSPGLPPRVFGQRRPGGTSPGALRDRAQREQKGRIRRSSSRAGAGVACTRPISATVAAQALPPSTSPRPHRPYAVVPPAAPVLTTLADAT